MRNFAQGRATEPQWAIRAEIVSHHVAGDVGRSELLTPLPGGPIDHHWTKSLIASRDGSLLYVGVGSNSNITENGMQAEENRAAIWEVDRASGRWRIFASGLRYPNGLRKVPDRLPIIAMHRLLFLRLDDLTPR